jgi:hypothetical protein
MYRCTVHPLGPTQIRPLSLLLDLHGVQLLIGKTMMGTRTLKHQQLVHPLGAQRGL